MVFHHIDLQDYIYQLATIERFLIQICLYLRTMVMKNCMRVYKKKVFFLREQLIMWQNNLTKWKKQDQINDTPCNNV